RAPRPDRAGEPRLFAERRGARPSRAHRHRVQGGGGARRRRHPGRRPDDRLPGRASRANTHRFDARGTQSLSVALPLAATTAIQTLVSVTMYCAPVMAPAAAPLLGVSPAAVGYFVTVAYLGSMIGTVTAGGWTARFGPIRGSQAAALTLGIVCALFALVIGPLRSRYDRERDRAAPVSLRSAFAPVLIVVRDWRIAQLALTSLVYGGVQITLVAYLVTFLADS